MSKKLKSRLTHILNGIHRAIPWVNENKKTLLALVLTLAATIITPSVAGNAPNGGEVVTKQSNH